MADASGPCSQGTLVVPAFRFLIPIAFQQTNRPVPVVYSLNTEFQLCNNEKVFLMDPNTSDMSLAEMDYKGAFSKGKPFPSVTDRDSARAEKLSGRSLVWHLCSSAFGHFSREDCPTQLPSWLSGKRV